MGHRITDLGELEREVLELVWAHAPIAAEAVQRRLSRPLRESTVRTVLGRLERKGFLSHSTEGRTFLYSATESRSKAAARAVKGIIDRFCHGSIEQVLVGMVDAQILDRSELQRLAAKIGRAKRAGRS
jgi:BlaI family transcriptional regulator, penicillinase repressor